MTLYSCSSGHIPSHRVTSAYKRPIESCSLTWASRVIRPSSPTLTVADKPVARTVASEHQDFFCRSVPKATCK